MSRSPVSGQQCRFQLLQPVADRRCNRHITGYQAIEQHRKQVVRLSGTDFQYIVTDGTHHIVEKIVVPLLKRQHEISALHQTDLHRFATHNLLGNNHIVLIVLLDLAGMVGIENVLHDQKIDPEMRTNRLHGIRIFQSVNLQPSDAIGLKVDFISSKSSPAAFSTRSTV